MTRRVGVLGMWHETNTYSAHHTSLADFEAFELLTGAEIFVRNKDTGSVIGGFCDSADLDLVPVYSAGAWPSGPVQAGALDQMLQQLTDGLRRAGPLDGLLIHLHGAMVGEAVDDVEAAVLRAAREVVGDRPIGAVLDLHANPSPELVASSNVLISYDTYPHVDMRERGAEVAGLMVDLLAGRQLRTTVRKLPLLVCPLAQATDHGPMRELQIAATARARAAGVARVSVVGGFAYSDVDRAGMSVLVVHDADRGDAAQDVLDETIADITARADEFAVARDDVPTAVAQAMSSLNRPVFLADIADNIGGGSPGDGTALLRELLAVGAKGAIVMIADAEVAREAERLGVGADLDVLLGGKTDRMHGDPIRVRGRIERISDGHHRGAVGRGQHRGRHRDRRAAIPSRATVLARHRCPAGQHRRGQGGDRLAGGL
jgi:microcystin degradation protein MlrC